jgi:hypothetical protein
MNDYEDILNNCDDECECANYHGLCGLGWDIFDEVKNYIKKEDYDIVAQKIADSITRKI